MESIDVDKPLPTELILNCAQNRLYKIGLIVRSETREKRSIFHKPLLVFGVNIILIVKCIISLLLNEENDKLLIINGDFGHFFGAKTHLNVIVFLFTLLALISQLIHYYNYKNHIKQTYFKVFEMMSGLVSPKSIGLTNKKQIYELIKTSKILFLFSELNNKILVPLMALTFNLFAFIINRSIFETLVFGIPNSLLFALSIHYSYSTNVWQMVYFYLICRYIKIKFNETNDLISNALLKRKFMKIKKVLRLIRSLDAKYCELNQLNDEFWSKFLLLIWLIFGTLTVFDLYVLIFTELNIFLRSIIFYTFIILSLLFLLIINAASSVNYSANKVYKLLNWVMVYHRLPYERFRTRNEILNIFSRKVKVKKIKLIL
jgi:hypothetical protein